MALFILCDVENYSMLIKSAYCEEDEYATFFFFLIILNKCIISTKMSFRDLWCIITEFEEAHLHYMGETYHPYFSKD